MALNSSGAVTASQTAMSGGSRELTARGSRSSGIALSVRKFAQYEGRARPRPFAPQPTALTACPQVLPSARSNVSWTVGSDFCVASRG